MATVEQTELVLEQMQKLNPSAFFKTISEGNAGSGAVLRLLYNSQSSLTAGRISEYMKVSTARVAVLLRKMADKGLITKENDVYDARVTIVHLSDEGEKRFRQIHNEMYREMSAVIDRVGIERIMDFISIADEIESVIQNINDDS